MLAMFTPLALVGSGPPRAVVLRPTFAAASRAAVQMYWHIFPRDGMDNGWSDRTSFRAGLKNEYNVEPGQQQALGCYDMVYRIKGVDVDPAQCVVQVADDGSCVYAYAGGTQPTGWRTRPDEPWNWMQPGESVVLQSGHKVSLDCTNPENAVYKFEKAGRFLEHENQNVQGPFDLQSPSVWEQQSGGQGQLPPGWIMGVDEASGQMYYYNEQTGQSQWDPPQY